MAYTVMAHREEEDDAACIVKRFDLLTVRRAPHFFFIRSHLGGGAGRPNPGPPTTHRELFLYFYFSAFAIGMRAAFVSSSFWSPTFWGNSFFSVCAIFLFENVTRRPGSAIYEYYNHFSL